MNLYLLKRTKDAPHGYDEAMGFVVAANSHIAARRIVAAASESSGADYRVGPGGEGPDMWLDSALSSCDRIGGATRGRKAGIILRDFRAG